MTTQTDFTWTGINAFGQKLSGKINAENKSIVKKQLEKNDLTIISIKKNNFSFQFSQKKFSAKQRLDFTQQLQLLLQASLPLSDSLALIANTSDVIVIKNNANTLKEKINAGISFSAALNDYPEHFDKAFCQMISAGEQSGQLDVVLTQLIENQEHSLQIKSKISKALFYPMSVTVIAMIITIGLLIFVIPQFSAIYSNFGAQLPSTTRCLITLSHYLSQQGVFYLLAIVPVIFFIKKIFRKNPDFKNKIYHFIFKLPFCRSLIITGQIAQWSQLLAMTLSSSIPLIDALHIANHAITQPNFKIHMGIVREAVIHGKSLHAALESCSYFPIRAKTMIAIGENADALPHMMKKIATLYRHQLNDTLDRLSKLLEPVIMMLVASLVSGLMIAMYLPIFRMGSVI